MFLPDKNYASYYEGFQQLNQSLISHFGSAGIPKTVLMDEEIGAQNACKMVFGWTIHSCYFHFTKSILAWIKNHGLKKAMDNQNFKNWINGVLGK